MARSYKLTFLLSDKLTIRSITWLHDGRYLVSVSPLPEHCSHGLSPGEFVATAFHEDLELAVHEAEKKCFEKLSKPLEALYVPQPRKEKKSRTPIANPLGKLAELLK